MKILNFGSCNIDYVYSLDHITIVGETQSTNSLETFCGGKGLNQSIAMARAGAKVYHAGCIGENGDFLLNILNENHVDTSFIQRVATQNGHAIIQVNSHGNNAIFLYPGSNEMISKEHIDKTLSNFSKGDFLLLQNEINNLDYIIDKAYKQGMVIFLNPSPFNEKIKNLDLNKISFLVLNEIEAEAFSSCSDAQKALLYFKTNYPKLRVMLTLGENGCIYQDENGQIFHPIFKVNAVDTTAAGDTFTGYFIAGITKENNVYDTIKHASCASAISVTRKGAAPSIPYIDEVIKHLGILKPAFSNAKAKNINTKIEEYVDNNLTKASIEGLAASLGYSKGYTGVLVKQITGESFKNYLHKKRLKTSANLLLESELTVGQIIKIAGYENESYFRKIFRDAYGKNPLEYRKSAVLK